MERAGPVLTPPRGGGDVGDYSLRDFAIKWLAQQADLAEIGRYRDANCVLAVDGDARRRVVFYGDSITEFWRDLEALAGPEWRGINRGIAGQNTTQMLLRFEDDVVELAPLAAVLLAGTNDLRTYAGPPASIGSGALERIRRNVTAMADIAAARGIELLIATLPPVGRQADVHRSPQAVSAVNAWLASFARRRGRCLIDYHSCLVDDEGFLRSDSSDDGVHPNAVGYDKMIPALRAALTRVRCLADIRGDHG